MLLMKREDVLEKSRKENLNGDERQRMSELKGYVHSHITVLMTVVIWLLINLVTITFWGTELTDNKTLLMILIVIINDMTYQRYKNHRNRRTLCAFILANTSLVTILVAIGTQVI